MLTEHEIKCFIIVLLLIFLCNGLYTTNEHLVNIKPLNNNVKWNRDKKCNFLMNKTVKNVLNDNNIVKSDKWNLYLPCTYNHIQDEINNITIDHNTNTNEEKRIFIIHNADELSNKSNIWYNLVATYGRSMASVLMPPTYILNKSDDMALLKKEFNKDNIYILKKNIQRQTGLKITNDLDDILNAKKEKYVVVQYLLQNPYTIDSRKINIRWYLLIVCNKGNIGGYVHKEGFMYYTRVPFKKNSLETDPNITTGYIDRAVYEKNPLTISDLYNYLDNKNRPITIHEKKYVTSGVKLSTIIMLRVHKLLNLLVNSLKHVLCKSYKLQNHVSFELFGVDIAISDELYPQIIEVNKGPDMGAKDEKDSKVKHTVVDDIFKTVKIFKDENNGFIPIF